MDHILAASDLSARSERALRRAFRLAEKHDAKLTVLSVVDEDLPGAMAQKFLGDTREALEQLCGSISDHPCTIDVDIADPAAGVLQHLEQSGADLLVLGTHRPRLQLFAGSTMERIVRDSKGPVLLVHDPADHAYQSILAGIDMSPPCGAALRAALRLAPEAEVTTFHAVHVPYRGFLMPQGSSAAEAPMIEEATRALDAFWAAHDLPESCARPTPVVAGRRELLSRKLIEVEPDLLVLGAHGRGLLMPSHLGSFTLEILRTPPCDILVVRS
ncbi:universal stress protein [Frigidibacter sp. ROC022]|uniref:universal stress protein n=1 Tax=Frigidibacter sp. ROC022 TaxID=2971796 RepID=UPI00215A0DF8|nr:universal stress protein [Frigidibacter sp. ROC022]